MDQYGKEAPYKVEPPEKEISIHLDSYDGIKFIFNSFFILAEFMPVDRITGNRKGISGQGKNQRN